MDTARQSNSGSGGDADDTPEDLIERSMRKAVEETRIAQVSGASPFDGPRSGGPTGIDEIAPVYRAESGTTERPFTPRPVEGERRPSLGFIAIALLAVGLMFVAYQCASGAGDTAAPATDEASVESDASESESSEGTGDAPASDSADAEEASTTETEPATDDAEEDGDAAAAGSATADAAAGDDASDSNNASSSNDDSDSNAGGDSNDASDSTNELAIDTPAPPASPESIAATLDAGRDVWRSSSAGSSGAVAAPLAGVVANGSTWIVSGSELLRYGASDNTWSAATDPDIAPLEIVDADANDGVLRGLVASGERAPAIVTWDDDAESFAWQPFALPDEAPMPDLLGSSSDGELIVGQSDLDQLESLLARNAEAENLLRDGGIDLEQRWIAGADIAGITYIDPSVPIASWTQALLTRSEWSTFGIEAPGWLAYNPDDADTLRTLQLVTVETVQTIPDPFGPDEFLLDLQGADRGFEATTWNGSTVSGPTRWTSPDGRSWQRRGPAELMHRGFVPSIDGAHVRAGDHEYRIRTLGTEALIDYRERGSDEWQLRQVADLVEGLGGAWTPRLVRVGPAALVIVAEAADLTTRPQTAVLLSRDGTSFVAVDPQLAVHDVVIDDTYVLAFDANGAVSRLDPIG